MSEIKNIPVEFKGKVIGKASLSDEGKLEITVNTSVVRYDIFSLFQMGLVTGVKLDFEFIPSVERIIVKE